MSDEIQPPSHPLSTAQPSVSQFPEGVIAAGTDAPAVSALPAANRDSNQNPDASCPEAIAELRRLKQELQFREQQLLLALESAGMTAFTWDIGSDRVERIDNTSSEIHQGIGSLNDKLNRLHPDDRDRYKSALHQALYQTGQLEVEHRQILPDGSIVWLVDKARVIYDAQGQPTQLAGVATNITERKQVERTLQRLTLHIHNTPLGVIEWNRDLEIERWCGEAERIFGWRSDEVLGKRWGDWGQFIHPDDEAQVWEAVRQLVNGQLPRHKNYNRNYRKDGKIVHCEWYDSAIVDASGNLESVLSLVLDVSERVQVETERQQAEIALRENQRFIQQITDTTPEIIYVHDLLQRSNVYINRQVWSLLGYTPAEIQAMGANVLPALIHPEDLPDLEPHLVRLSSLREGEVVEWEYRMRQAGGDWRWFLGQETLFRRTPDGQAEQVLGIIRDVTDRKAAEAALRQSEAHYRYLSEAIPQLVWTASAAGGLLEINQRWSDYTGLTLSEAQQDGWTKIVHPEDLPALLQEWSIARQRASLYRAECRMKRQDGIYRWHLVQAVPLKNEQDQIIKWFGTSTDIEDQKQIEQQRTRLLEMERIARSKAEEANRIKDEFLRVLSHELRTPLNPILGWSKLLRSGKLSPERTQQAIATIERNAELQVQLVNDLIDVSQILRGKLDLKLQPLDLNRVTQSAIDRVRLAANAKAIDLQFQKNEAIDFILGDDARLQQVIWNLLSNAVKFTASGGRVEVKLESFEFSVLNFELAEQERESSGSFEFLVLSSELTDSTQNPESLESSEFLVLNSELTDLTQPSKPNPQNSYILLTITDTGKGIHPQFLPHLFEYFRQQDGSTTREYGGLGLGLAIVRHIVELHGGTITASSPGEDQGATFVVRLPVTRTD